MPIIKLIHTNRRILPSRPATTRKHTSSNPTPISMLVAVIPVKSSPNLFLNPLGFLLSLFAL
ncbi:unnamed protein product [Periconia digitata]|uniref:Uncharacterized protein n=1 Tax=Periconia digitata TaxID=1303443 RepID=A0A9W4U8Z4_9PLEO|nr:unnamed protein product [Periconia digitata]